MLRELLITNFGHRPRAKYLTIRIQILTQWKWWPGQRKNKVNESIPCQIYQHQGTFLGHYLGFSCRKKILQQHSNKLISTFYHSDVCTFQHPLQLLLLFPVYLSCNFIHIGSVYNFNEYITLKINPVIELSPHFWLSVTSLLTTFTVTHEGNTKPITVTKGYFSFLDLV